MTSYYYIPSATSPYVSDGQPFTLSETLYPGDWLAKAGAASVDAIAAPDHEPRHPGAGTARHRLGRG